MDERRSNNMGDLVFNPETGLFENVNDPTAHIIGNRHTQRPARRPVDPERARLKPRIMRFTRTGDERPKAHETIALHWEASPARLVRITFPDGNRVEFPPYGNCYFVVPPKECKIILSAVNGRYRTMQTMTIQPRQGFLDFIRNLLP